MLRTLVTVDYTPCLEALDPLRARGEVEYRFPVEREWVLDNIGRFDAYLGQLGIKVDEELLNRAPGLRVVATCSTGTDHIDKAALAARGIALLDIATDYELLDRFTSTAELAWGLLLACRRRIPYQFERSKRGEIGPEAGVPFPPQLSGKTLGVLGYGRLGKMVAEYGKAFRMRVLACDITPISAPGIEQVELETLIRESDVLSLHLHLREDTHHIISRERISRMKPGAVIINTARGDLIDEEALIDALESGHLAAAGLDTIHDEWDADLVNHRLLDYARTHHNLVLTPHLGGASHESVVEARAFIANKVARFLHTVN